MQYKILASDYDNTLVPFGEGKPRQKVVKAVKKLQAAGGKFVLSTGRAFPSVNLKGQLGGIRFDYAITCNGACVVDREGRIVAEHPLTGGFLRGLQLPAAVQLPRCLLCLLRVRIPA